MQCDAIKRVKDEYEDKQELVTLFNTDYRYDIYNSTLFKQLHYRDLFW